MTLSYLGFTPVFKDNKLDKHLAMQSCVSGFNTIKDKVLSGEELSNLGTLLQNYVVYSNVIWNGNHRKKENAVLNDIDILIFDIDDTLSLNDIHQQFPFKVMTLTTTSHTQAHNKFRVFVPLDKQISFTNNEEYSEFLKLFNEEYFQGVADKSCLEAGRAYISTPKAEFMVNAKTSFDPTALMKKAKQSVAINKMLLSITKSKSVRTRKPSIEEVKQYSRTLELVAELGKGNNYEPVYKLIGVGKIAGLSNEECAKMIMSYKIGAEYNSFSSLVKKASLYDKSCA